MITEALVRHMTASELFVFVLVGSWKELSVNSSCTLQLGAQCASASQAPEEALCICGNVSYVGFSFFYSHV